MIFTIEGNNQNELHNNFFVTQSIKKLINQKAKDKVTRFFTDREAVDLRLKETTYGLTDRMQMTIDSGGWLEVNLELKPTDVCNYACAHCCQAPNYNQSKNCSSFNNKSTSCNMELLEDDLRSFEGVLKFYYEYAKLINSLDHVRTSLTLIGGEMSLIPIKTLLGTFKKVVTSNKVFNCISVCTNLSADIDWYKKAHNGLKQFCYGDVPIACSWHEGMLTTPLLRYQFLSKLLKLSTVLNRPQATLGVTVTVDSRYQGQIKNFHTIMHHTGELFNFSAGYLEIGAEELANQGFVPEMSTYPDPNLDFTKPLSIFSAPSFLYKSGFVTTGATVDSQRWPEYLRNSYGTLLCSGLTTGFFTSVAHDSKVMSVNVCIADYNTMSNQLSGNFEAEGYFEYFANKAFELFRDYDSSKSKEIVEMANELFSAVYSKPRFCTCSAERQELCKINGKEVSLKKYCSKFKTAVVFKDIDSAKRIFNMHPGAARLLKLAIKNTENGD